jgi:hypothetical protein
MKKLQYSKKHVKEIRCEIVNWIQLVWHKIPLLALVDMLQPSVYKEGKKFIDQPSDCQLLKKDPTPRL